MSAMQKIAIQGYEGCFHHIAANQYFGRDIEIIPRDTFREVATTVKSGEADMGLMAIENSIAGSIIPNYSILQDENLQVAGEVYLPIKQNLMVLPGVELEDIEEVQSHSMALLQCIDYLDQFSWKLVESEDTALSARHIAEKFHPLLCEMEGCAVAQVCLRNDVKFTALKSVSDRLCMENSPGEYFNFPEAMAKLNTIVLPFAQALRDHGKE